MDSDHDNKPSFSGLRRFGAWINLGIALVSVLALVVMANYLGARHFHRDYWTPVAPLELSAQTKSILKGLTNDVRVIVFYDPKDVLYPMVSAMIEDYRRISPRIQVETVNYTHNPGRAEIIKQQYKLSPLTDKDLVIFDCAGRSKIVRNTELSDYDMSKVMSGESKEIRRKAFTGEPYFTSAILTVSSSVRPRVYFVVGHGEHDPTNDKTVPGYGKFAQLLDGANIALGLLPLHGTNEIPAECNALVIAGARAAYPAAEIAKVDKYLAQGGRLLLLFPGLRQLGPGGPTGLENLAARWGTEVGANQVRDLENSTTPDGLNVKVPKYGSHPMVKSLEQSLLSIDLVMPRSVTRHESGSQKADALQVTELAYTGPNATAYGDIQNGVPRPNPYRDHTGQLPLAVAVEKAPVPGVQLGGTRLVIVGDSMFLNNEMIESGGNRNFASLAMNWLLDRSQMLGISSRPTTTYTISLTQGQMRSLRLTFLVIIPGSVLALGCLVWWRRRH